MENAAGIGQEAGRGSREVLPDVLRGFAVLLVALGHAIQQGNGAEFRLQSLYFEDPLYWFIYSFHMPLFMLISGFFSYRAVTRGIAGQKSAAHEIVSRASKLILPVFLWSVLDYLRSCAEILSGGHDRLEILALAEYFPVSFLTNLWFLWSVFLNFLAVLFVEYIAKRNRGNTARILLYGMLFLIMFVTPDGLNLGAYKFMFPYFLIGFFTAKNIRAKTAGTGKERTPGSSGEGTGINGKRPGEAVTTAAAGLLFAGLFLFYRSDALIYVTGYKLIGQGGTAAALAQLGIDLYRFVTGLAGSLFFYKLFRLLLYRKRDQETPGGEPAGMSDRGGAAKPAEKENILVRTAVLLGRESMGIYILSGYIQTILFLPFTDTLAERYGSRAAMYGIDVLNMAAAVLLSLLLIRGMSRVRLLRKLIGGM